MKKINRILILFLVIMSLFFGATWQLLQSNWFAQILSNKITSLFKESETKLSFEELKFVMFPPGIELKSVKVENLFIEKYKINNIIEAGELEISFNLLDFFARKLSIKDVTLKNGRVSVNSDIQAEELVKVLKNKILNKSNNKNEKIKLIDFAQLKEWGKRKLPFVIRKIEFENVIISLKQEEYHLKKILMRLDNDEVSAMLTYQRFPLNLLFDQWQKPLDELDLAFKFSQNYLEVDHLKFTDGLNSAQISMKMTGPLSNFQKNKLKIMIGGRGDLDYFLEKTKMKPYFGDSLGLIDFKLDINGTFDSPQFEYLVSSKMFRTKYFFGEEINLSGTGDKEKIILDNLEYKNEKEHVSLKKSTEVFNLKSKKWLDEELKLAVKDLFTNTFLYTIRHVISPLKANVNGDIGIRHINNKIQFKIYDNANIQNLKVVSIKDSTQEILSFNQLDVKNADIIFDLLDHGLILDFTTTQNGNDLNFSGTIDKKNINFKTTNTVLNFDQLGTFGKVKILGAGPAEVVVNGPPGNVEISVATKLNEAGILGFNLGTVGLEITINLNSGLLVFNKFEGIKGKSFYSGSGEIGLKEGVRLGIKIDSRELFYHDLIELYSPVLTNIKWMPENIQGVFQKKYEISGKANLDDLVVRGSLQGQNLIFKNEKINDLDVDFKFANRILSISQFNVKKQSGLLTGEVKYNTSNHTKEFKVDLNNLYLEQLKTYKPLPIGVLGVLSGHLEGIEENGMLNSSLEMVLSDSRIGHVEVPNSVLKAKSINNVWNFKFNLLDRLVRLNGVLDSTESSVSSLNKSSLDLRVKTNDLNLLAALIEPSNMDNKTLKGEVDILVNSKFNPNNRGYADINLSVNKFNFTREQINGRVLPLKRIINIDHGQITNWDIAVLGNGFSLSSQGRGLLRDGLYVDNKLNVDGSIFEIISDKLVEVSGIIDANLNVTGNIESIKHTGRIVSKKISLNYKSLPGVFEGIDLDIAINNKSIFLEKFKGFFGSGKIDISGSSFFDGMYPRLNFLYKLENSYLSIFEKSNFLISGEGSLTGLHPPYLVSGNFVVGKTIINDDFDKMGGGESAKVSNKYIPQLVDSNQFDLLELDITADSTGDVEIKNSIGEMKFSGNIKILGTLSRPRIGGQINLVPGSGKLYFKSSDFILNRGVINFYANETNINPNLNFLGKTTISEYDIELKVFGRTKNFDIELSSNPALSQEDIFSLLAIGFTGDESKDINEQDRGSLAGVGIGSILFNKAKINQGLHSSLGLNLSVTPEFVQTNESLLTGRSTEATGSTSRVKTATKVKIQKRISDVLAISVGSTVGGSVGQTQEMNLNYELKKNVLLQGVYEVKTDDSLDDVSNSTSVGADLKFKWTFK